jgi:hypothetical protein
VLTVEVILLNGGTLALIIAVPFEGVEVAEDMGPPGIIEETTLPDAEELPAAELPVAVAELSDTGLTVVETTPEDEVLVVTS